MARTYKTMGFSVPPGIALRIDEVTRERHLTKSELFREMFRAWENQERMVFGASGGLAATQKQENSERENMA